MGVKRILKRAATALKKQDQNYPDSYMCNPIMTDSFKLVNLNLVRNNRPERVDLTNFWLPQKAHDYNICVPENHVNHLSKINSNYYL